MAIPVLYKDFVTTPYQVAAARAAGASAVLLIAAVLDDGRLRDLLGLVRRLGFAALVETHDAAEIHRAVEAGARIIGVNNRNLKDFSVDTDNSRRLRRLIPKDVVFVSESGVKTPEDVQLLREVGADAVLIGETLMRAADKKQKLNELRGI